MKLSTKAAIETKTKSKLFKSKFSKETRQKMAKAKLGKKNPNYGKKGEDSYAWKGGSYTYYHLRAKELHGKEFCEKCGIKLNEKESGQELDMHCWYDYKNLKEDNWACVCRSCHKKIHHKIDMLKF